MIGLKKKNKVTTTHTYHNDLKGFLRLDTFKEDDDLATIVVHNNGHVVHLGVDGKLLREMGYAMVREAERLRERKLSALAEDSKAKHAVNQ